MECYIVMFILLICCLLVCALFFAENTMWHYRTMKYYLKQEKMHDFDLKIHRSINMEKCNCAMCGRSEWGCYMSTYNWGSDLYCDECVQKMRSKYAEDNV